MAEPTNPFFEEMNRDELAAAAPDAVLVVPVGATEQHGPHLPTGTDTLNVSHVARAAATSLAERDERAVPVVVAPSIPYGSSAHHLPFGATLSLAAEVLLAVLRSLGQSAAESGFTRLFFLNGHGGNEDVIRVAAREISREQQVHVASGAWWDLARGPIADLGVDRLGRVPGHAGAFETSAVMAVRPDLLSAVRDRTPGTSASMPPRPRSTDLRVERPGMWTTIDGFSDDPGKADADLGADVLAAAVAAVADAIEQFHDSTRTPDSSPSTP